MSSSWQLDHSAKEFVVHDDHTSHETGVVLHETDISEYSGEQNDVVVYLLLQAPKRLRCLAAPIPSANERFSRGQIQLSPMIRRNLQVFAGDKIIVSKTEIRSYGTVSLRPIINFRDPAIDYLNIISSYLKSKGFPYPLHRENVIEVETETNGRIDFIVGDTEPTGGRCLLITEKTRINVNEEYPRSEYVKNILNCCGFADLGGVDRALEQMRMMVQIPLTHPQIFNTIGVDPPGGILLHGPSGTGKTTIVKALARETGVFMHRINGPDILGRLAGETEKNLQAAFEVCEKNAPSILFIDEIDSIAPKREKAQSEIEKRIVSMLLTLMDGMAAQRVAIIAATNRPNVIEPALRRHGRFDKEIEIPVPDKHARLNILKIKARRMKMSDEVHLKLEEIAASCHGYVGADLSALVAEAGQLCVQRTYSKIASKEHGNSQAILDDAFVTMQDFNMVMEKLKPSALREKLVETPSVAWDQIGGLGEVKKNIQEMVQFPILHADQYERFGVSPSRGVLFYGPPGCGKTLLAKAAASMCGVNFISVKGPELLTMWLGESEANVREIFDRARAAAPCILFFDEIDSLAPKRGSGESGGATDRVINQLLTELDGIGQKKNVFIIGATNRLHSMDNAILRPGRLDQLIGIPLPDEEGRLQILRANLGFDIKTGERKKDIVDPDVDIEHLARYLSGYSGADLAEICSRAVKCAISEQIAEGVQTRRLTRKHFKTVMKDARRSVTDADIREFNMQYKKQHEENGEGEFDFPPVAETETPEAGKLEESSGFEDYE